MTSFWGNIVVVERIQIFQKYELYDAARFGLLVGEEIGRIYLDVETEVWCGGGVLCGHVILFQLYWYFISHISHKSINHI